MMRALLPILALSGCTFAPGTGFARLSAWTLDAAFEPGPARDLGDGWVLTDLGYRVRPTALSAAIDRAALQTLEASGGAFDPANPPPGYTLCHGGHCHSDDGRLVDYVDIEAELAGDTGSFVDVASAVAGEADLLRGEAVDLRGIEPSAELPAVALQRAALQGVVLRVEGEATGADLGESVVPVAADLRVDAVTEGFDLGIDRDSPERVRIGLIWTVDGTFFDGQDLGIGLDPTMLEAALAESELHVEVN